MLEVEALKRLYSAELANGRPKALPRAVKRRLWLPAGSGMLTVQVRVAEPPGGITPKGCKTGSVEPQAASPPSTENAGRSPVFRTVQEICTWLAGGA